MGLAQVLDLGDAKPSPTASLAEAHEASAAHPVSPRACFDSFGFTRGPCDQPPPMSSTSGSTSSSSSSTPSSSPPHKLRAHRTSSSAKVMSHTKTVLSKQAKRLAKKADEHEQLISKVTYSLGVLAFGGFCYLLGARPYDIPRLYAAFFLLAAPLRWAYYRSKKWHYFLLDFCYYANLICTFYLLFFSKNEKLFLLCFAFSEGPLAWALIVWRCSLVFSSVDKIVSVLIHLLPGTVIFIIRWWDPITFSPHPVADDTFGPWPAWPHVESTGTLWLWMFAAPLGVYAVWQLLYFAVVHGVRNQRIHKDPEVLTSFRELSRKASRANNFWWRLSGILGEERRFIMYALFQAVFTVLTMALTVPMFLSYRFHAAFQFFKIMTSIWNGGNFFFDVMPRQVRAKAAARTQQKPLQPGAQADERLWAASRGAAAANGGASLVGQAKAGKQVFGFPDEQQLARAQSASGGIPLPIAAPDSSTPGFDDLGVLRCSSLGLQSKHPCPNGQAVRGGTDSLHHKHCVAHGSAGAYRDEAVMLGAAGSGEGGDQFLPAIDDQLWMGEDLAQWEEPGKGANGGAAQDGLRRRAKAGNENAGLETERSLWHGSGGSVACMG